MGDNGNGKKEQEGRNIKEEEGRQKICHKFPPMMVQRKNLTGGIEMGINPLVCFKDLCWYWCEIDNSCIDACKHIMEHAEIMEEEGDEDSENLENVS